MGQGFSAQDLSITYTDTFPQKNEALAKMYLQDVIDYNLNNQQLFGIVFRIKLGSGFQTLYRPGHVGSVINTYDSIVF